MDLQAAYRGIRRRLSKELPSAGPDAAATRVPATPDWTVKDVVAHLAGILADIRDGNLVEVGTDGWTARHVREREDRSLDECLEEWNRLADELEPTLPHFPHEMVAPLISDAFSHEQDIRGALGRPGAHESEAFRITLDRYLHALEERLTKAGLALRIEAGGEERVLGAGEPGATWSAEPFEILRSITGRRSPEQIRAGRWDGDPEPYLEHLSAYPMRSEPLEE